MNFRTSKSRFLPSLEITPLIDVVFLLLVFLLLTMTFSQNDKSETEEAIIDIELAKASTTETPTPTESITLLIDETGALYRADAPLAKSTDEIRLFLAEKLISHPDLNVSVKADRRTKHGQVVEALDLLRELGIKHANLVIEKTTK